MEHVVTSSTNPGFGGWFDDPMIRLIQVERLELQPCPTLFSERFAPSVSHFGDENNNLCQLLTSDPSLCSIFDAERLLRRTLGPPTNAANEIGMEFESILQYPLKVKSCGDKNWSPCTEVRVRSDRPFPHCAASSRSNKPPVQKAFKPRNPKTMKLNRSTTALVGMCCWSVSESCFATGY